MPDRPGLPQDGTMHVAQVNVTRAVTRLDSPRLQGFADLYGPLDDLARVSPGFVWRP